MKCPKLLFVEVEAILFGKFLKTRKNDSFRLKTLFEVKDLSKWDNVVDAKKSEER